MGNGLYLHCMQLVPRAWWRFTLHSLIDPFTYRLHFSHSCPDRIVAAIQFVPAGSQKPQAGLIKCLAQGNNNGDRQSRASNWQLTSPKPSLPSILTQRLLLHLKEAPETGKSWEQNQKFEVLGWQHYVMWKLFSMKFCRSLWESLVVLQDKSMFLIGDHIYMLIFDSGGSVEALCISWETKESCIYVPMCWNREGLTH